MDTKKWINTILNNSVAIQIERMVDENVLFGFKFPSSFNQIKGFKDGDENCTSRAHFYKNGYAKIIKLSETREVSWLVAYDRIVVASHGQKFIPDPVDIENFTQTQSEVEGLILDWCKKFSSIPFIEACQAFNRPDCPDLVIVLLVPSSLANAMENEPGYGMVEIHLLSDGSLSFFGDENKGNKLIRGFLTSRKPETWGEGFEVLSSYILKIVEPISEIQIGGSDLIEFTLDEFKSKILGFQEWMKTLFEPLGNTVSIDTDDSDAETGKMFSIDIPVSLQEIEEETRSGWLKFYQDGKTQFDVFDCNHENEPLTKLVKAYKGEDMTWKDAVERAVQFLNELQELVPNVE